MNHPFNEEGNDRYLNWRIPCADQPLPEFDVYKKSSNVRYTGPDNGTISVDLQPQRHFAEDDDIAAYCYEDMVWPAWKRGNVDFCPKYTLGAVTSARITVLNRNPTITVEAVAGEVTEGEPARFRLTRIWNAENLHPQEGYTTTVEFTAAAEGGYVAGKLPAEPRTFGFGVTEMIIEVPTVNDGRIAPDGEITLELLPQGGESSRVNVGASYEIYDRLEGITPPGKSSLRATVRIINDDDSEVGLVIGGNFVAEGDGTISFPVTLTQPAATEVTVQWATGDGSAVAGQDYVSGNGTLRFAAGATAATFTVDLLDDAVAEPTEDFSVSLSHPENAVLYVVHAFGSIRDDDPPDVTIAARTASVVEGDDAVFVLTRAGDVGAALDATVNIRLYAPAAPELPATARFRAGSRTAEAKVPTTDDGTVDTEERVIRATVTEGDGYAVGDPGSASITVTDNDAVRRLHLDRAIAPTFAAAGNEVYFGYTVTNLGNVASGAPLTIVDDVAGELTCSTEPVDPRAGDQVDRALCGTNYVATAADVAAGRIVSTAYASDGVTRSPAVQVVVVQQDQAVLSICNGAQQEGAFCDPTWEVAEDAGSVTLTVFLSQAMESEVRVPWATVAATATAGEDFGAGAGTLTFDPGERTGQVVVTITDDALDESRETFHVDLGTPHNAVLGVERGTVAIRDDDPRATIAVEGPVPAQPEEDTNRYVEYYLTLGVVSGRRVQVSYATADGAAADAVDPWPPAVAGKDYERTAGRLTFEPGESRKAVRIPILSDALHENREEFRFTVSDPHGADLSTSEASPRVVIRDDDAASGRIILTVSPNPLPEAGGDVAFTVTGTFNKGAQQDPVTVDLEIAGGTATAGTDFTAPAPFQLTIPGAALSGAATVTLSVTGDDLDEEDETLLLTGAAEGFTMGPEGGRQITITDDDTRGLAVSATALAIDEGADASYTVALASQPTAEVTVAVSATGADGLTVTPASLTFTAADWSVPRQVTVAAAQDADGADEAAVVAHDATGGDYGDESAQVTVRVADDETPSTAVALTAQPPAVAEGGGSRDVTVTATLNAAPRKTETAVAVTVQPEAATPGAAADWAPVDGFTITIPAGQPSAAATFTLAPVADDVDEADERVALRGATGVEALPAADAFVTVTDDDERGVTVSATALAIDEGADASYTVALTSAPTGTVAVAVALPADGDLRADPRLLEFTAADWSSAQTVTVHAIADADAAADDAVILTHAVSGGDYDGQSAAGVTVTINETDTLAIALADAAAAEAAGAVTFTVTLTAVATELVSVAYATADGSARAGADYAQTRGTLTFAPGDLGGLIRVPVTDDALDEADAETFTLTLRDAAGAPLPDGAATLTVTGTIEDDDARGITVAPTALALAEDGAGAYTVALSSQPSADVTVALTVSRRPRPDRGPRRAHLHRRRLAAAAAGHGDRRRRRRRGRRRGHRHARGARRRLRGVRGGGGAGDGDRDRRRQRLDGGDAEPRAGEAGGGGGSDRGDGDRGAGRRRARHRHHGDGDGRLRHGDRGDGLRGRGRVHRDHPRRGVPRHGQLPPGAGGRRDRRGRRDGGGGRQHRRRRPRRDRGGGEDRRRRRARDDGVRACAGPRRGRPAHLHGGADLAADRGRDGGPDGGRRPAAGRRRRGPVRAGAGRCGGDRAAGGAELHGGGLADAADGDRARRGRPGRGRRPGAHPQPRARRRLRPGAGGRGDGHGARRRHRGADRAGGADGGRGPRRQLPGGARHAAHRAGDRDHRRRRRHRPDGESRAADLRRRHLGPRAEGDGDRRRRRGCRR